MQVQVFRDDLRDVVTVGSQQAPARPVREKGCDRLLGAMLVRADDAGGASLDPARGVDPGHRLLGVVVNHPTLDVRQHPATVVERHTGQLHASVTDRPQDQPGLDLLDLIGTTSEDGLTIVRQLVAYEAQSLDSGSTDDLQRRQAEP